MKEEDWCVEMTPENKSVIINWGGTMGWFGTSQHYGMEDGRKAAHWRVWGKLLTTEEFYQKIGYQPKGTTQFKAGKWYKYKHPDTLCYLKCNKESTNGAIHYSEFIDTKLKQFGSSVGTYTNSYVTNEEVPFSEIQQYLPEGHVDKIKVEVIPEYVELLPGWSTPFTGRIFKTDKYIKEDYWPTASSWNDILKNSLHKKYFKPSTKEAFEAQNKPKEPRTEVLTEGDYYTIENYYLGDTNHVMIGKVIVGNNGDNNYGNLRGIAAYLATHDQSFRKNDTWCYKDTSGRTPRKSTFSERQWLDACIKANKFIPKEEALKSTEFKVGDWVRRDKFGDNGDVKLGTVAKIRSIQPSGSSYLAYLEGFEYCCDIKACVLATPEEIAKVTGKKEEPKALTNEALLAEARRRYPIGTRYNSLGGFTDCKITEESVLYERDNCVKVENKYRHEGELYNGSKWAEIISKPPVTTETSPQAEVKVKEPVKETSMEKLHAVGTRVKLKEGNEYMYQSNGTEGTITKNSNYGDHIYSITWDNKNENAYRHSDLELVRTAGIISTNKVQPVLIKETPIKNPGTLRHQRAVILH